MALFTKEEALEYHKLPRRGKVEVIPVKPCNSQKDLSMAYSPGVAEACKAIHADPTCAALYTGKSNLVAVVSDGTAVLGLGNIGPLAGKPVMEGKGVLFKTFADIDVFDINLDVDDPDELIKIVKAMEPTFGGINLEDIKAPECFYIEEKLKELMNIPVFHDDQHGTAVISGAGLFNACEITNRKIEDLKVVVVGAGAAGIACTKFYVQMGIDPKNIFMFDSRGLIHKGRTDLNRYKSEFAQDKDYGSLAEVIQGADCFLGLSKKGLLTKNMVRSMAKDPVIFAMANPDPEITYDDAKEASPTCIMGTGRSDYPNQVNNVSGFPYIFRGALDVGATIINEEMKVAAAQALADLAKEPVPSEICDAYGVKSLSFGIDYIIPKPLDPRVLEWEVPAVAQAAMDTGVATMPIQDMEAYKKDLKQRINASHARIAPFVESYYK
ncbi:malic enzyme-like NAD(P)-binding protein [Halodesulfovibrio marinisediminis]|uniref:Malate dehydrogenase (Oxaloacetate-decarboxylating)(NADP+) n=1 Tax=Halodesulfovibrio marinisediminis DSM 17456 TaxID=1121457 RepID=A0A1N6GZA0_9BACT|nr:malic enzyme-like NAD(P)-binding protein [Halodesulfovibrio marinisediminis]SIO12826.1 malate dehydrogenase (oxaloacetate-decarboxylating)(NADP+) [Halodesulfovibrio marinisediminis DSM 17456]